MDPLSLVSTIIKTYYYVLPIHPPRKPSNSIPAPAQPLSNPVSTKQSKTTIITSILLLYLRLSNVFSLLLEGNMNSSWQPTWWATLLLPQWHHLLLLHHGPLFIPSNTPSSFLLKSFWFSSSPSQHTLQRVFQRWDYHQPLGLSSDIASSERLPYPFYLDRLRLPHNFFLKNGTWEYF